MPRANEDNKAVLPFLGRECAFAKKHMKTCTESRDRNRYAYQKGRLHGLQRAIQLITELA